jgi:hypothetical protein
MALAAPNPSSVSFEARWTKLTSSSSWNVA